MNVRCWGFKTLSVNLLHLVELFWFLALTALLVLISSTNMQLKCTHESIVHYLLNTKQQKHNFYF